MTGSPTATERTAIRTGYAALHAAKSPNSEIVEQIVLALGAAGLLQSPEIADEPDRFRSAWKSARERAAASSETILRVVGDRELYQGWLRTAEAEIERLRKRVAELEAAPSRAEVLREGADAISEAADELDGHGNYVHPNIFHAAAELLRRKAEAVSDRG